MQEELIHNQAQKIALELTDEVFSDFLVFSGAKVWPHNKFNLGVFQILKKIPIFKKKNFFFEDWHFHSVTTHKLHGDILLPLHLISPSI